ncbi:MAG: hypothetical protein AAF401_13675 [Pseudomonadota bacterium]
MSIANILIALGLIFIVAGLSGLVYCINLANRIKTMDPSAEEIKSAFYRISAANMASMGGAFLGLALLLAGLIID